MPASRSGARDPMSRVLEWPDAHGPRTLHYARHASSGMLGKVLTRFATILRAVPGAVNASIFPAAIIRQGLPAHGVRHHQGRARRRYNLARTLGLLSRPFAQSTRRDV